MSSSVESKPEAADPSRPHHGLRVKHWIETSQVNIVKEALENGMDPNVILDDFDRWFPLAWAARYNQHEIMELLIQHGANVNMTDENGCDALKIAVYGNNAWGLERLVAAGAHVNHISKAGDTVLHLACHQGNTLFVRRLLQLGAAPCINAIDDNGQSPLLIAASKGHFLTVKEMLANGADVSIIWRGKTILYYAVTSGSFQTVRLIVEAGAAILSDHVELAIDMCLVDIVHYLCVTKHYGLNTENKDGITPLMYACQKKPELVEPLLAMGADPSYRNKDGMSALCYALDQANMTAVEQLLACGAEITDQELSHMDCHREDLRSLLSRHTLTVNVGRRNMRDKRKVASCTVEDRDGVKKG